MTKAEFEKKLGSNSEFAIVLESGSVYQLKRNHVSIERLGVSDRSGWGFYYYKNIVDVIPGSTVSISASVRFGADPEVFVRKLRTVVPSRAVVPDEGLDALNHAGRIVQDGFQAELHPESNHCREIVGSRIGRTLLDLRRVAKSKGLNVSLKTGVVISDKVWNKTPEDIKRFGCNPTDNAHFEDLERGDGMTEKFRAGGGHIHIALDGGKPKVTTATELVRIMDILAGNTFVMLDRDEANIERRRLYGRAGEYRLKPYGIEYRVLSNFWLRNYILWSFASALLRNAVGIQNKGLAKELFEYVNLEDIRDAINNNDYELAKRNFEHVMKFFKDNGVLCNSGLSVHNINKVYSWLTSPEPLKKLGNCTELRAFTSWRKKSESYHEGFEKFINRIKV